MKSKHKESIVCLVDATESILNAMEKHGIDADEVASKPEFKILVHLIKTIIDSEVGIHNELSDKLKIVQQRQSKIFALEQQIEIARRT